MALASLLVAFAAPACSSSASPPDASHGDGGVDGSVGSDASLVEASTQTDGAIQTDSATRDASQNTDAGEAGAALGYMIGVKTNSHRTGPATVQGWLGRPIDIAGTTITTTSYVGGSNESYTDENGALPLLEVSFPLLSIFSENPAYTDLAR